MSLVLPAKSYWIETYGCQMNVSESAALENDLFSRGWSAAAKPEDAALVILHTCSVRQTAENRIWGVSDF
jgi:tRNA-2-methylthio-N6-dimethylallyladenosine synthase